MDEPKTDPWEPPQRPTDLPEQLPSDLDELKRVAVRFLDVFGNTRSKNGLRQHGPLYTDALAAFRARGSSTTDAWDAFCQARLAHDGKPLFGSQAKSAMSYLLSRAERAAAGITADIRARGMERVESPPAVVVPEETAEQREQRFATGTQRLAEIRERLPVLTH